MTGDLLQLASQNIGSALIGISGLTGVSTGALAYFIYRRRNQLDAVDLRTLVPGWRERDIARLFGVMGGLPVRAPDEQSLLETMERAAVGPRPLPVAVPEGDIRLSKSLLLNEHARLIGYGADTTRLVGANGQAAIYANGTHSCAVCNLAVTGTVKCSESEVVLRDCDLSGCQAGAAIDAAQGSVVTFSGRIATPEGGIAIRARSGSRVILEKPFDILPSEQIIMEPGCEIVC